MKVVATLDYVQKKQIGVGQGMNSTVFLADDPQLAAEVAVKEIPVSKLGNNPASFFNEAKTMFASEHKNVLPIRYACRTADRICLAMPFCNAGSLADRIRTNPLSLREVQRVGIGILNGLAQVHLAGFVHFDLKPTNVLFGPNDEPLVADFGQSRQMAHGLVQTAPPLYKWSFPPETLQNGTGTLLSDVYHAGVTLYRAVNGEPIFAAQKQAASADLKAAILSGRLPDRTFFLPHVPKRLRTIIRKALRLDPALRHQSATDFVDQLASLSIGVDWSTSITPGAFEWTGAPSGLARLIVRMEEDSSGRWDVCVNAVGSSGKVRAKAKDLYWKGALTQSQAFAHLKTVFEELSS